MLLSVHRLRKSSTVKVLAALLMAYVVLLPVYGPLLDPSFAERLPYHRHVYPNGLVTSHLHSYQVDAPAPAADVTGVQGGVVALPFGDDGAAAAFAAVLTALLLVAAAPAVFVSALRPVARPHAGLSSALDPPPPRLLPHAFA